ncbi:MAG: hypothetical protein RLZZ21_1570 [Planctomycetota bacterium]
MPREPAYAATRRQDAEAQAASERAKNRMFAASVRRWGVGNPKPVWAHKRQVVAYRFAMSARVMHFTLPALPAWPNCSIRSAQTFFIASREGFR